MKPVPIVATVVAAVLVAAIGWMLGPGASWWLEHVDGVTGLQGEKLAAAVDAVRGRALAVATGLAALLAVYYTARNADTARRTFQLGERGHDTDRYSKAVEQLGSDQAPVRLGGLYTLEQLAQNNPALRQRIVDVIAAYLRMPYTPPKDDDHEDARPAVPRAAIGGRADQARGRDPHEERQVRLTAQRILIAHLRCPTPTTRRRWQRATPPPDEFWSNIYLDLTGALLIDFHFYECRVSGATFEGVTFSGVARFDRAVFSSSALFIGATFSDVALFRGATFSGVARFDRAAFNGAALFQEVTFSIVSFDGAAFNGVGALFDKAAFSGDVLFSSLTFGGDASFEGVTFGRDVLFRGTTFSGIASFRRATFNGRVGFAQDPLGQRIDLDQAIVAVEAINADRRWPPGWVVEPEGKGGGRLRRDSTDKPAGTAGPGPAA